MRKRSVEQKVNAKRATAHLHVPERGEEALAKRAAVEAATSIEELEDLEW
jgi:hypothetical protein